MGGGWGESGHHQDPDLKQQPESPGQEFGTEERDHLVCFGMAKGPPQHLCPLASIGDPGLLRYLSETVCRDPLPVSCSPPTPLLPSSHTPLLMAGLPGSYWVPSTYTQGQPLPQLPRTLHLLMSSLRPAPWFPLSICWRLLLPSHRCQNPVPTSDLLPSGPSRLTASFSLYS